MNITISKVRPANHASNGLSPRVKIHKSIHKQLTNKRTSIGYTTEESTCVSSGVSMNCSEEFFAIEKSEEYKSRDLTQMTTGPQSGSLLPSSASEASRLTDDSEAIYYFGYGPIVDPIVRLRRGCNIAPENIKTAILYDHRLKFVAGGTANIVKSRGWDVKGVLLRFENQTEFEAFRQFDANYDVRDVSVSIIDKTNLDPKKKNDHTAPFDDCVHDELDESYRSTGLISSKRTYSSCLVAGNGSSLNDLSGDSSSEDEDYSCPFSFEPKSARVDPNAVKCKTFMIDQDPSGVRHVINENTSFRGTKITGDGESVFGKPQERYLKLMTDGLRFHGVDETYIRDEVLAVNYIPNERDRVVDKNYRSFPKSKKFSKMSQSKYEKLCKSRDKATHFVIGNKIIKVDTEPDLNNAVIRWLRAHGDGKGDMTLLIHQTVVDKDAFEHEPTFKSEELTPEHTQWAEHVVFLYLERGDLTATAIGELTDAKPSFKFALKPHFKMGRKAAEVNQGASTHSRTGGHSQHERSINQSSTQKDKSGKRGFGAAFHFKKKG